MSPQVVFPKGFLWGAATAAHQVEGNNVNSDSWLFEHAAGTIFAERSGDACDHYHRYPDDIALMAHLGFNSYRFSIEWARIEPEKGEFSLASLEHYRRMLVCCHEHGLKPIVSFHHYTSPRWLIASGGWENKQTADRFATYCERVTRHLGDLISIGCTLNEPNLPTLLATSKLMPPTALQRCSPMWLAAARTLRIAPWRLAPFPFTSSAKSLDVKLAAHRQGREAIKSGRNDFPVGLTLALTDIQAEEGGQQLATKMHQEVNDVYLEALRNDDFVGVQTYSRMRIGAKGRLPPGQDTELSQMGDEFYPEALETTIRYAASVARIPVLVTENGIATADDTRRVVYIQRALQGIANCLYDGLDVRGYIYWTLLDNFEWIFGYRPTFGLIAVDRSSLERTIKPSAYWLSAIARANGFVSQAEAFQTNASML